MRPPGALRPTFAQLARAVALCEVAGALCLWWTSMALRGWFPTLEKPVWMPPSWAFAPLWLGLSALLGVALAQWWATAAPARSKRIVLAWFWVQLGLTLLWSAAFFGWRSPSWGYALILFVWLSLVALLWTGSKLSPRAAWLVAPFFLWITFASALNFSILSLNVLKAKTEELDALPANQDKALQFRKSVPATREDKANQGR